MKTTGHKTIDLTQTDRISLIQFVKGVLTIGCLLIFAGVIHSQQNRPDRGFQQANAYSISDIETVNLSNGNLMLNIPIASLPSGRGSGAKVSLHYNSKLWDSRLERRTDGVCTGENCEQPTCSDVSSQPVHSFYTVNLLELSASGGWFIDSGLYTLNLVDRLLLEEPEICKWNNADAYYTNNFRWKLEMTFPDGSVREFRPYGDGVYFNENTYNGAQGSDGYFAIDPNGTYRIAAMSQGGTPCAGGLDSPWISCPTPQTTQVTTAGMHYFTTDGSGIRLFVPYGSAGIGYVSSWTMYFPDGRVVENRPGDAPSITQRLTDRNGNKITWRAGSLNGVGGTLIENEIGHAILVAQDKIIQRGFNGEFLETQIQWKDYWTYKNYKATDALNAPAHARNADLFVSFAAVEKIILPTQMSSLAFEFSYNGSETQPTSENYTDGWGELNSIKLPSEAVAEYEYLLDSNLPILGSFEVLENSITRKDLTYQTQYDGGLETHTETWQYSTSRFAGSVSGPDGGVMGQTSFYSLIPDWRNGLIVSVTNPDGTRIERIWDQNVAPRLTATYGKPINPFVKTEFVSIPDSSGQLVSTAIKDFAYDKNGNLLEVLEYDWVPYGSVPRTNGVIDGLPSGITLLRKTVNSYYYPTPIATDTTTDSPNHYSNPNSPALLNLIKSTEVRDANDLVVSRSEFYYDGGLTNPTNGNLTETRVWDSFKGGQYRAYSNPLTATNSISTFAVYDLHGNVTQTTDANGTVTQITYGDVAGPNGNVTGLYPTQTIAAQGTNIARTSTAVYDFYTGLPTSSTDVDNGVTNATEYDALGRPTKAISALGVTGLEAWTRTEYDDINRRVIVHSDLETKGDGKKVAVQFFDQLGRVRLAKTLEDATTQSATNETDGIKVQTRYFTNSYTCPWDDSQGAAELCTAQLTSNPFRAATSGTASGEETMGWTLSQAQNTGRYSTVTTYAGANLPAGFGGSNANSTGTVTTLIDANRTLVTDQAGKQRRSVTNALGQLIRVDEPDASGNLGTIESPTQPTHYYYNTLGKMVRVNQGVQNRYFMHDSLGRLLRVRQPEQTVNTALNTSGNPDNNSWTIGFTYDNNGNLLTSLDANNVVITSTYDALNRQLTRSYSDSTPTVTYTYDDTANVPFSKGRLTKVFSTVSETRYTEYDEMGRLEKSEQRTDGEVYPSEYKYNLAGALIEQKYPSGRVVKNVLDASGDISNISSRVHNGPFKNYASNFEYTAGGVIKHLQIGNGLWESAVMNSRNQVLELKMGNSPTNGGLMHLTYEYGEFDTGGNVDVTKNAGNIAKQTITFNGLANPFVQSYKYDSLDRITEAKETVNGGQTWIQTFGYDRYGNRTSHAETVGSQAKAINEVTLPAVDASTNKFSNTTDYEFDAVGNLIRDIHGRQFTFNGDNKQVEVRNSANQVVGEYKYDGLGKRIKKETATEYVVFVYDGLGKLIGEYSADGPPAAPTVNYTATDPVGSPRVLTNKQGEVVSRRDFMPFGEEIVAMAETHRTPSDKYGVGDGVRQKFTGYERDEETGLDFAEARYYYNNHGRFTAVDPLLASGKSADPQTFNRYAYTMNRPLILTDPTGLQSGTPKPSTKPEEGLFDILVQALGLPKPIYVDEPYERIPLGEPGLLDSLAEHATSAIVTFAENNGSDLLLGPTDVEHTAAGRIIGDTASIVQGVAEVNLGLSMTVGGGAGTVATAPACATGVGCAAPAATATVSVSGVTVATHGAAVISNTIYNQANRSDSGGGNNAEKYNPAGRSKIQTGEDALDQLEGVSKAQENTRRGKGTAIVDSKKKSEQRVDNKNRKIRNLEDAYDEYPDN